MSTAGERRERRARVKAEAAGTAGIRSRSELLASGISRWEIKAEHRAERWQILGRQTVRVDDGDPQQANWWRAIHEVGRPAVLDGVSALIAAGLKGVDEDCVHVAVPKSANPRQCRGVRVHETRRYDAACVAGTSGVPRMRAATAAVHAVLWARSDREAQFLVIAAHQQRLFTATEFAREAARVRRDRRRRLLHSLHAAIAGGIEAMGELDFARLCAAWGIPKPTRQTVRRTEAGTLIYDNEWEEYDTQVEIDGSHHLDVATWMKDVFKQNVVSLEGRTVIRIPNIALGLNPRPFMEQVVAALRRGGWPGPEGKVRRSEGKNSRPFGRPPRAGAANAQRPMKRAL